MSKARENIFEFEDFRLDPESEVLFRNNELVDLTPKALAILHILLENSGKVVSKEDLMRRAWPDSFVEEANLSHHIFKLRKALGEDKDHKLIETVPKRGYRFVGKLTVDQAESSLSTERRSNRGWLVFIASVGLIVLISGTLWLATRRTDIAPPPVSNAREINSIAVMPFVNDGGDADVEYLSDGMTETLIAGLSQLHGLGVKPSSVMRPYKGRDIPASVVGTDLEVSAVLYGRLVQRNTDLTLFLSLIDSRTEYQIWGKQYVRKMADLASLQNEIGRDVSLTLADKFSATLQPGFEKNISQNGEAYRQYLIGQFYWNKFTEDGVKKAISAFEKAIGIDPSYARAYTGLANSYSVLGVNGHMPVADAAPKCEAAANRAIELNDSLSEAHTALGGYKLFFKWNLAGAESQFQRAIELDPDSAPAHELYSYVLSARREFDGALEQVKKAHDLDPLSPVITSDLAAIYRFRGDLKHADDLNRQVTDMDPEFPIGRFQNALTYSEMGDHEKALAEINAAIALPQHGLREEAGRGVILARAGQFSDAQKVIDKLKKESGRRYVSPLDIAMIYSVMDKRDEAFEWLEVAYSQRTPWLFELDINPAWDPIRQDPRFDGLRERVGLNAH